ncbi:hypothetical protein Ancab_000028 [Ancistrocladus abbreviatus]
MGNSTESIPSEKQTPDFDYLFVFFVAKWAKRLRPLRKQTSLVDGRGRSHCVCSCLLITRSNQLICDQVMEASL